MESAMDACAKSLLQCQMDMCLLIRHVWQRDFRMRIMKDATGSCGMMSFISPENCVW